MLSFYLIWSLSYFTLLWWMGSNWKSCKIEFSSIRSFSPQVTLIIPFRNERENIPDLLVNLTRLQYPNLEILLIDDHSEDGSPGLLTAEHLPGMSLLYSPAPGKKSAIEFGVQQARGEVIICSDADCVFTKHWIEGMVLPFYDPHIQLVAGPVLVKDGEGVLDKFQRLDWASVVLMTSGSFTKKSPLMCSGANFAYRKEAFERVEGYEGNRHLSSGDDEFLLKKIYKTYGADSCAYLTSPQVLVCTKPEPTWRALIQQRVRWASKWKAHSSFVHASLAIAALWVQVIWIGSFYLLTMGARGILVFGGIWLLKALAENHSLGKVLRSFGGVLDSVSVLKISLLHPFYVLRVALGALRGKFTWKGRENWRSVNLGPEI
ncbi:glycosyltransferase [Algoriphagus sp. AGSA1]|uniref:glycosyltransferase n=1 Tax=Algoriphagus sp. AGSA1 TaxID=2907213 RepID=UPI001F206AB7|nr:glycosyltransferase [Algoriphagus sp. AGSA1]MCE7053955.1 glycosyltransferase [Algoriphagus sp. AGSA1]